MSADAGLWRASSGGQNPFRRSLRGSRQRPEKPMQGGRKWRLASRDLVTRTESARHRRKLSDGQGANL